MHISLEQQGWMNTDWSCMYAIVHLSAHGDLHPSLIYHPSLLYTWGPSNLIVHMGTIHPYCTHGDHPSLLHKWGPSIPIVHMGTIHPFCIHGCHSSLLYSWGPSILLYTWGCGIEHLYPCGNGGAFIAISSPSLS